MPVFCDAMDQCVSLSSAYLFRKDIRHCDAMDQSVSLSSAYCAKGNNYHNGFLLDGTANLLQYQIDCGHAHYSFIVKL